MRLAHCFVLLLLCESSTRAKAEMLLSPTGPYPVGRLIFHWQDASRPELLSSKTRDKREVGVWVWYPAIADTGKQTAPYIDQLDALAKALSSDEVSLARVVETHAVSNAPPSMAPTTFPVLILSPGSGGIPALYTSFCEDLASHGYFVAAIDHPYDDLVVRLSDGRVIKQAKEPAGGEKLLQYQRERVHVRVEDVRFVLNQLMQVQDGRIESPFRGRLDFERIGVLGHSRGGMTAAEACMKDQRVKACANLDGVVNAMPAYDDAGRGPVQPFLFMEKPLAAMKGEKPEDAKARLAFLRQRGNTMLAGAQSGHSYRVTLDGATHVTFSDEEIISDINATRPRRLLDVARTYLREFFDEALNGRPSTVLSGPPSDGGVQVQVFSSR
jgi:predicted dienelactone hydrolase